MESKSFITRYKEFLIKVFPLAWPIILQDVVTAALGMLDIIMLGHMGSQNLSEISISAVSQSNQSCFIVLLIYFGIVGGASVFFSQFYGKKDFQGMRKILGVSLTLGLGVSLIPFIGSLFFSTQIMHLFVSRSDVEVTALGAKYLFIIGFSFPILFVSTLYGAALRSTENAVVPMIAGILALVFNALMNYLLIYGFWIVPALGVEGAAIGTVLARLIEFFILIGYVYINKNSPLQAKLKEIFSFKWTDITNFFKTSMPVILQETLWGGAMTVQFAFYGHMGRNTIAAVAIIAPFIDLSLVAFMAIAQAVGILIGNMTGETKSKEEIQSTAWRGIFLSFIVSLFVIALFTFLTQSLIPKLYHVNDTIITLAKNTIFIFEICFLIRGAEIVGSMGILRGAGDTLFGMLLDGLGSWFIMVPIVYITGIVFHYSLPYIQAFSCVYDAIALMLILIRLRGTKWIKDVSYKK